MLVDQSIKRKTIGTDTKPDIVVWASDDDLKALDSMFKRAAKTDL